VIDPPLISDVLFTTDVVWNQVRKLKDSKTVSPDGFSSFVVKLLAPGIIIRICKLFGLFYFTGFFPDDWKVAYITPVFKTGSRQYSKNYRSIAYTSIFCRIIERVIKDNLVAFLGENRLVNPSQHGFLRGKSTITNLMVSVTDWEYPLDNRLSIDVIYLDLKKAFETVVHSKLLDKLYALGIRGKLYVWIRQFIFGRSQAVCL